MTVELPATWIVSLPLVAVRWMALFTSAPIFGHSAVPARIRVALSLLFALATAGLVAVPLPSGLAEMAGAIVNEALVGFGLGFGLRVVFSVFAPLGELISLHGGLGAANVLDPASGASSGVMGVLLQWTGVAAFLAVDGHHEIVRAVAVSFDRIPVGIGFSSAAVFDHLAGLGASVYELTVRLAAPVTAVMLVSNVGVGILGRAIPQLNLIALQLPAHIAIVLVVLALAAGPLSESVVAALRTGLHANSVALLGD